MKITKSWIWGGVGLIAVVGLLSGLAKFAFPSNNESAPTNVAEESPATLAIPVEEFWSRITKKPFGIYITPATSPVRPEKFTGYHTGTDVEFSDARRDVLVRSVAAGKVVISRTATGYGGLLVIDHRPEFEWFSLYGHVDPASIPKIGTIVRVGEIIGKLAPAYSVGSGGERKHLHLGIINQPTPNIVGYVSTEGKLTGWLDAAALLPREEV